MALARCEECAASESRPELPNLLRQEIAAYRDILDLLKLEQESLLEGSVEELSEELASLERMMAHSRDIAVKRLTLMLSLADREEPQDENSPGGAALSEECRGLLEEIASLLAEMDRVNAENSALIRNSLDYVRLAERLMIKQEEHGGAAPGVYRKEDGGACVRRS